MPEIHFVVGIWRSGTTMLREVLDMSDDATTLPEHLVLLNHLSKAKNFSPEEKAKMLTAVLNNKDFLHFAKPNLDQLALEYEKAIDFESAIRAVYSSCLKEEESPSLIIDKNPIYSYYLPELLTLFPKAKFIWMLREPKDNCISRAKHKIQHFSNYMYLANWWNHTNHLIAQQAKKYPERFLLVHYDAMCESPEQYTKRICDFLDIPFDIEMLNFRKHKEEKLNAYLSALEARDGKLDSKYLKKKYAMWENLQKPINTSKTKQWKKELSLEQIIKVNTTSEEYYHHLINGEFDTTPQKSFFWNLLVQMSLTKLKLDIRRNVKH